MIIKSVNVKNFKSLLDVKIANLNNINLLYGYNNSGKSNILKFLELVFKSKTFESISSSTQDESLTLRQVIEETEFYRGEVYDYPFYFFQNLWNDSDAEIAFEILLNVSQVELSQIPYLLENNLYSINDFIPVNFRGSFTPKTYNSFEIEIKEISLDTKPIFSFEAGARRVFPTIKVPDETQFINFSNLFNNAVLLIDSDRYFRDEAFSYNRLTDLNSKNLKQWYYHVAIDFEENNNFKKIEDFIKGFNIVDDENPNFNNLPFNGERSVKKLAENVEVFLKNGNLTLPIKNFGTGIQQIFYILSKIFASDAKIIIIEEFELNLSKRYQIEFLKYLKIHMEAVGKQLIFTSHSPYIADEPGLIDSHYEVLISKAGITSINYEHRGESGHRDWITNH